MTAWAANPQRRIEVTTFGRTDGVRLTGRATIERPVVAKSADGRIWMVFPGMLGLIDPANLRTNAIPPPVHVERITADGTTFEARAGLRLPSNVRDLRIEYTATSLVAPEKVRFRFRLEGQDPDWTHVINERTVRYSNLRPGDYKFHVAAANNDGVWNEQGDVLEFSIAPAYYQTNAFRVLSIVVFAGIFWMAWQLRVQRLRRQLELTVDARVAERTRIARELHDTLLQSVQGLLLKFQSVLRLLPERPIEARQRLERALDQATDATTQARDAVQGLRSMALETDDLVEAIRHIGTELAAESTTTIGIEVDGKGAARALKPIVQLEVYRIAGEAVRNAFRHSHAHHVRVEIRFEERRFRLRVADDGRGIDERVIHRELPERHFGLHSMRERAEGVGGRLDIWSKHDTGTQVDLSIPARAAYGAVPRRLPWFRLPFRTHAASDDRVDV
jgi:signal transduction histidine kinase